MSLTREQVTAVQTKLREAGYLYKEPDGVWDYYTQRGYQNFLADKQHVQNPMYVPQPDSLDEMPEALKGAGSPPPPPPPPPQKPPKAGVEGGEGQGGKPKKQE